MPGLIDPDRLCVILVSTRNPLNIGAAARAMRNFGFHHLRLVHPYDIAFREARSAVGASTVLTDATVFSTVAEAVADCTLVVGTTAIGHRQMQHPLHVLKDGASSLLQHLAAPPGHPSRVAILFGSEKVGLSNEDLSHCHWLMHIPTREAQPSMNLGQAVAVCLYELARDAFTDVPITDTPRASAEELERLTTVLLETLHTSEYVTAQSLDSKEEDIRRMVRRMQFSTEDAATWLGMLRQILWKLRAKN
ncbi:MAG: TrmJ/YjtD family RNA methyltransferase [Acidobacteriaceae bacterium]